MSVSNEARFRIRYSSPIRPLLVSKAQRAALRSAESTAAVHGRLGSPNRAVCVFVDHVVEGDTDRADTGTIQSAIAARLTKPFCDRVVGQPGMPACAAHLHCGVIVHWFEPGRVGIELGRHELAT
jgi:hypothetical protein